MAIYVTGDTHCPKHIRKLGVEGFPEQRALTKKDYVIICGDFGGVWDGGGEDRYWMRWLEEKSFTTLVVDGNHENFDLLNAYPVEKWCGGKIHKLSDSVYHLMRGQVFEIAGLKFFTMGGATSIDKHSRVEGKSWWVQEQPSIGELEEGLKNLDRVGWEVDIVLTHTTSNKTMELLGCQKESSKLNSFLDMLETELAYKRWYFGHFHKEMLIEEKRQIMLYHKIEKIGV